MYFLFSKFLKFRYGSYAILFLFIRRYVLIWLPPFLLLSYTHLTHWDGSWSYRSYIMADAEAAEKGGLFQTVVF